LPDTAGKPLDLHTPEPADPPGRLRS
jgi:hypothetical protein